MRSVLLARRATIDEDEGEADDDAAAVVLPHEAGVDLGGAPAWAARIPIEDGD